MDKRVKYFIITFVGAVASAQGARMIVEYFGDNWYRPNLFDLFFDWTLLFIMGLILMIIGVPRLYKQIMAANNK